MESTTLPAGVDPLSDVLKAVRLTGAVFFLTKAGPPWTVGLPATASFVAVFQPPPQHLISYHVVTRGSCWCFLEGEPPLRLEAGDVLVIPHGDSYTLSTSATPDALGTDEEAIEFMRLLARRQLPFIVQEGTASEPRVHVLCGFLGCDIAPFNPVLAALPRRLHIRHPAQPDRLDSLVEFAMSESAQKEAGSDCVLLRLSELMFVEVVRRHLSALPEQAGWLSALRDSVAGRALALLHNDPARAWSLQTLAREAGVSRTLLADRFASTMGQPPMQYLKQWRMQLAAGLLAAGDAKVALVALRVGYESEAAFSRAFKKEVGVPPSLWRTRREPLL